MEYIVGVSLEDRIQRTGHLRLEEVLRIGMQIASGLAASHAQGLVHRDIKPANILLENGVERVKITDFGLARVVHEAQMTQSNVVAGTPQFMSPEQASGKPVDHRSDLFSLGCVLYAMCTGRSPFRAETPSGAIHRVITETPRPIREVNPDMPEWLVTIIDRLLEKDPDDRFQTAGEVAEVLSQYLAHVQQPSRVQLPAPPAHPARHRAGWFGSGTRKAMALVAATCLCFGTIGLLELTGVTNFWPKSVVITGPEREPTPGPPPGPERFHFVDLQQDANRELAASPNLSLPENVFGELAPHRLQVDDIPLKLGPRRIQLSSEWCPGYIDFVHGIKVNRTAAKLHFLHGAHTAGPHGSSVAKYTLHYEDGSTEVFPVISGRHLCDWWRRTSYPARVTRAKVAWLGTNPIAAKKQCRLQIFLCTYSNPHPEKTIATIDFDRGTHPYPAPFLMAITCDDDPTPLPPEPGMLNVNIGRFFGNSRYSVQLTDSPITRVRGQGKHNVLLAPGRHRVEIRDAETLVRSGTVKIESGTGVDLAIDASQTLFPLPTAQPKPMQELLGQGWGIRRLALAHDGKTLASIAGDGSISIWRLDDGAWTKQRSWHAHEGHWFSVALSPDSELLATASDDGFVRLWGVSDGRLATEFKKGDLETYSVTFSPDGQTLVSGNNDGTIDIWDVPTRAKTKSVKCHEGRVYDLTYSPDGKLLAICGVGATVELLDVASWKTRHEMFGHTDNVLATAFSPDGKTLASASKDTTVRLWNVETGQLLHTAIHPQALRAVAFSPNGKQLAAAGDFHTVRIWDLASKNVVHDFHAHWNTILDLAFGPNGNRLLSAGFDNSIRVWSLDNLPSPFTPDANQPRPRSIFSIHKDWSMDVAVSHSSDELVAAVGLISTAVQVRRLKDSSLVWKFSAGETGPCSSASQSMLFAPKNDRLIMCVTDSATRTPQLSIWDPNKRVRNALFKPRMEPNGQGLSIPKIALASDGAAIVLLSQRARCIVMIDLPSGNERWSVPLSHARPISLAISPDGQVVAIGTKQGLILLLDATTGEQMREPLRHGTEEIWAIAWSSEGVLVSTDAEGSVKLWDSGTYTSLTLPQTHRGHIWSAALSQDGQTLATSGGCWIDDTAPWAYQGEVCIWDVKNRKLLAKFHAHFGCVTRAVFSPSGKTLATTGRDGKMCLWNVADILKNANEN